MKRTLEDLLITRAPDEGGAAVADADVDTGDGEDGGADPQIEAAWKEINDQKAELGRKAKELEDRDRQLWDKVTTSKAEPAKPKPNPKQKISETLDRLENLDLVENADAAKQLAADLRDVFTELDAAQQSALRDVEQRLEGRATKAERVRAANERNDRLFDSELSRIQDELGIKLNAKQTAEVKETWQGMISARFGSLDRDGNYLYKPESVAAAIRANDSTFELIRNKENGKARSDGLQARRRGEDATRSTARNARRQTAKGDDDFYRRYEETNAELRAGTITPQEAATRFSSEELKRISSERRGARR